MEQSSLPPKNLSLPNLIKAVTEQRSTQNADRLEPHMLFLPHDVSRRMSEQLKKENSDIHMFVHQACIAHLNKVDNDKQTLDRYLAFSDLQLMENATWKGWSFGESDEDIFKQKENIDEEGE